MNFFVVIKAEIQEAVNENELPLTSIQITNHLLQQNLQAATLQPIQFQTSVISSNYLIPCKRNRSKPDGRNSTEHSVVCVICGKFFKNK